MLFRRGIVRPLRQLLEVVVRPLEIRVRRDLVPQEAGAARRAHGEWGRSRHGDVVMTQRIVEAAGAILEIG